MNIRGDPSGLVSIPIVLHIVLMFANPELIHKLQSSAPYLGSLYYGVPFFAHDLTISLDFASTGREELWLNAVTLIRDNPFFGVSSGAFRLQYSELHNTHNLLLQNMINAGLVGGAILTCLAYHLRQYILRLPILLLFVTLLVDFPLGHSLPYIISISFIIVTFAGSSLHTAVKASSKTADVVAVIKKPADFVKTAMLLCLILPIILLLIYQSRQNILMAQTPKLRLVQQLRARTVDMLPVLISSSQELGTRVFDKDKMYPWHLVNTLDTNLSPCYYRHLKHRYSIVPNQDWLAPLIDNSCNNMGLSSQSLNDPSVWLASRSDRKRGSRFDLVKKVKFFSPMIKLAQGDFIFKFSAQGESVMNTPADLQVVFVTDGQADNVQTVTIRQQKYQQYMLHFNNERETLGYFIVSSASPFHNNVERKNRRAWINASSINVVSINKG